MTLIQVLPSSPKGKCVLLFLRVLAALAAIHLPIAQEAAESLAEPPIALDD